MVGQEYGSDLSWLLKMNFHVEIADSTGVGEGLNRGIKGRSNVVYWWTFQVQPGSKPVFTIRVLDGNFTILEGKQITAGNLDLGTILFGAGKNPLREAPGL